MKTKFAKRLRTALTLALGLGLAFPAAAIGPGDVAVAGFNGQTLIGEVRILDSPSGASTIPMDCGGHRFYYSDYALQQGRTWRDQGMDVIVVFMDNSYTRIAICRFVQ